jgi:hypothetical protein
MLAFTFQAIVKDMPLDKQFFKNISHMEVS